MDELALHPRFKEVKDECVQFPEHAEQLFQVYLDLTLAKEFEDVSVIQAPLLGRCLIECTHPDTRVKYLVLPAFAAEPWTVASMESTFSALDKETDARLSVNVPSRITLGVITGDSTITYINLTRGIPPEKPDSNLTVPIASATNTVVP
ncbi:hypothetical protein BGZ96_006940 [Linnemannia gamsii]|uniref:tRNA-splicing endonuclease subunit Sen15 domain-containing protein n=1 Tax=Linnemannia gamsii TaxID=64522 RepID=A0ABQ7K1Z1_9FUNG|nr:hypothetical protein BGZ96_006940 [Linnemannia gamsii]